MRILKICKRCEYFHSERISYHMNKMCYYCSADDDDRENKEANIHAFGMFLKPYRNSYLPIDCFYKLEQMVLRQKRC